MKTKQSEELPAEDLAELDRLVLHEFEALRPQPGPLPRGRTPGGSHPVAAPSIVRADGADDAEREGTTDAGLPYEAGATDGDGDGHDVVEFGAHGAAPSRHGDLLLDKEEAAFVRNVVRWLSDRPNRDDLIARIWTELSAADPDGFYDASAEDAAEAAGQTPEIEEEGEQEP